MARGSSSGDEVGDAIIGAVTEHDYWFMQETKLPYHKHNAFKTKAKEKL